MAQVSIAKGRTQRTYDNKVRRIKSWYNKLQKYRTNEIINPNTKLSTARKQLKDMQYYIDLIKKPNKTK